MHLNDTRRFLRKMTPTKALNAFNLLLSYYISKIRNETQPWGMPMTISVEPTTACNLRCPECPSGLRSFTRSTGTLDTELFEKIIDDNYRRLIYLIFYFQGEPYINPSFLSMVNYAHKKGIYTITSTNGHFLNDANARETVASGLDRLIISVDGATQEVYQQYRQGGSLDNVIQGTQNIVKWKHRLKSKTPHIIYQCLVVKPNEHQLDAIKSLADYLGVDEVKYKTAQIYDYKYGNELIPDNSKYSRYRQMNDGTYSIKGVIKNECWKLWHATLMTWDGQILPCCFDKDATHPLGKITEHSLNDIWRGPRYKAFRRAIKAGREHVDICSNCSEGCKVWA